MSKLQRGAICVLIAAAFSGGAVAAPCGEPSLSASAIVPGAPITLRAVMDEIAYAAPQVRRAALETKAREAEVNQAGRRLNPVVGVELENFAGSGPLSGLKLSPSGSMREPERRPNSLAHVQMPLRFRRLPKVQKPASKVCVMISRLCGAARHLNFPRPLPRPRRHWYQPWWTRVKSAPILYLIWRARRRL